MTEVDTSIYKMPEPKSAMEQMAEIQNFQAKKMEIAMGQQKYITNVLGSLYGKPDLSADDIIREGSKAVQMGIIPQSMLGTMLGSLPQEPQALRQWVGQAALRAASANQQLEAHAGQFSQTDTGAGVAGYTRNPMTGRVEPAQGGAAYMPKSVTPGDAQNRVSGRPAPDGSPTQRPAVGAAVEDEALRPDGTVNVPPPPGWGANRLVSPPVQAQQPNKLGVQPPAPRPLTQAPTPILGPQQRGPSMSGPRAVAPRPLPPQIDPNIPIQRAPEPQATASAPTSYGDLSGAAKASQSTGLPQGSGTVAENSARQFVTLQKAADGARDRKAIMQNMEDHLKNFTPGIVGDKLATGQAAINGVANAFGKGDVFEGVANKQQFDKLAATLQQQRAALGVSSDAGLANAGASTPNSRYTKAGIEGMLANLKGNEDAIQIKNQEANKWLKAHGPNTYGDFQQEFNSKFEPRVFGLPYMTPKARHEMVRSLTPSEQKSLDTAYQAAVANGWIKRIGGN